MAVTIPKISPAKGSLAEKFCHMMSAVCQMAMSVRSASVKASGNGTRIA
ncbi:hypothetical protein V3589_26440 [Sinorhizobium fredii]